MFSGIRDVNLVCFANRSTNRLGFSVYGRSSHRHRSNLLPVKKPTATTLKKLGSTLKCFCNSLPLDKLNLNLRTVPSLLVGRLL
jgi:hypothetical protein